MSIFHKAAKTAFRVAKRLGLVHNAIFKSVYDNGLDEPIIKEIPAEVIKERFTIDDIRGLIFRDKIQPTDIKLYVLGAKVSDVDTDDIFIIDNIEYTVFGCEIDAAKAMWVVGVR
jgi:hypothetical protein